MTAPMFLDIYECQSADTLDEWGTVEDELDTLDLYGTHIVTPGLCMSKGEKRLLKGVTTYDHTHKTTIDTMSKAYAKTGQTLNPDHWLACNNDFRPTEDQALEQFEDERYYDDKYGTGWADGKTRLDSIVSVNQREQRSAYVKGLDAQHQAFKKSMMLELHKCKSVRDIYALVDLMNKHDDRLSTLSGRSFCDTYNEICNLISKAETRINTHSNSAVFVVDTQAMPTPVAKSVVASKSKFPIVVTSKGGGKAMAFTQGDLVRLQREGFDIG